MYEDVIVIDKYTKCPKEIACEKYQKHLALEVHLRDQSMRDLLNFMIEREFTGITYA